jgi:hypothetical protein
MFLMDFLLFAIKAVEILGVLWMTIDEKIIQDIFVTAKTLVLIDKGKDIYSGPLQKRKV